jgi:hypothetical protein
MRRSMLARLAACLLLAAGLRSCITYEYEHEFWLKVDGSGTVNVTGRPELWVAFKGLGGADDPESAATRDAARALFERSGLSVKRVTLTHRGGRPYLFVSADFKDLNALRGTPAFPDFERLSVGREGERLSLYGIWKRPFGRTEKPGDDGLMAVRFHLPSKVYEHKNAADGVERGNIVGWRQDVAQALTGRRLEVGALMDPRSILVSTVGLFAIAIAGGLSVLALGLYLAFRKGQRENGAGSAP